MIVPPPGVPVTMRSDPSGASTIVGVMAESILLPAATAFRSPWTSPNWLGVPGLTEKSSISLFMTKPAPVTVTLFPYNEFNVVVTATALPCSSTIEKCVVFCPSAVSSRPGPTSRDGVAEDKEIDRARSSA